MAQPLSVLIVEDMESDAQLIVRMLSKAGFSPTFERVETAAQLREALEKQAWEIVISDFSMPELDGHAALKLFHEAGLDIPFIAVSGTMGEETAVAMMKAGAHDYVMKGNLSRLGPAVERELSQAEVRRERKQAEEKLQIKDWAIESSINAIAIADLAGHLTYVNPAFLKLWGYSSPAQVVGESVTSFWQVGDQAAEIMEALQVRGGWSGEMAAKRKDGASFDVEVAASMVKDVTGRPVCMLASFADITERKQAEGSLRKSNELLHLFMKHSPIYAFIKAVTPSESRVLSASDNFQQMIGVADKDIVGKTMGELFPDEFAAKITAEDWDVIANGEVLSLEEHLNDRTYATIKFPIVQGDRRLLAGYTIDITERKQAEETLRDSEARYRALFQGTPDGILIADLETRVFRYANPAVCRLLGYSEAELRTMGMADIHPKADLPAVLAEFEAQARGDKTLAADLPCLRKDGTIVHADVSAVAMSVDGRACSVGFFRDITERRQAEEQLNEQLDELRRWHKSTLGREMRVLDLKREVNELLAQTGLPPRYHSPETEAP